MQMVVGYKLIDQNAATVDSWGGTWGQCPGIPNPLVLPNGDRVHAPSLNTPYSDYTLVEWLMDEPPPAVPASISPRQVRLLLFQQNMLADVEAMIAQQDQATQITWQYAQEFRRDDPLLTKLASNLSPPLSSEEIDAFFVAAAAL